MSRGLNAALTPWGRMLRRLILTGSIAGLSGVASCAHSRGPASPGSTLTPGTWGGQHIAFVVANSAATVEFDCAHGGIDGAIPLDLSGHFDVSGTFVLEQGGPARPGVPVQSRQARYAGSVSGNAMSLTVTAMDPVEDVGTFNLALGQASQLVKCL